MISPRAETGSDWSVARLLKWSEETLRDCGLPAPRLDAELLLAQALGSTRLELYTDYRKLVEPAERASFRALVERRVKREPVAYITGQREFYSLRFEVNPAVLIPRPETEQLVEAVLEEIASRSRRTPEAMASPRVLDLGTGSGNVAVAVAVNAPRSTVDALDSSGRALEVARRNAARHGVAERVRFFQGDLFSALPETCRRYDAVASNPPYISASEHATLMDDVRLYEPEAALLDVLSPERDGLGFYRRIAEECGRFLEPHGILALEVGQGQAEAVRGICSARGWKVGRTVEDHGGIERVVVLHY